MKVNMPWKMTQQNDTGLSDEGFWEWFEVSDGVRVFKCDDEAHAKWLCDLLNQQAH